MRPDLPELSGILPDITAALQDTEGYNILKRKGRRRAGLQNFIGQAA
jgi:hypothetical protein